MMDIDSKFGSGGYSELLRQLDSQVGEMIEGNIDDLENVEF